MFACVDIIGRDIAESFMIAPVVVVLDERSNRFLQLFWHPVRHEVNLSFDSAVVSFYLAVGLGMIGGGYDVPDPGSPQPWRCQ